MDTADDIVSDHGFRSTVNWPKSHPVPPALTLLELNEKQGKKNK